MGSNKPKKNKENAAESKENPGSGVVIKDARFSSANWDPKFREAPKYKSKVKIDSRFTRHLLKNQNFAPSKASIDKRGKQKQKNSGFEQLNRYYRIEGEGRSSKQRKNKGGDDSDSCSESESDKVNTKDVGIDEGSKKIKERENEGPQIEDKESDKKKVSLRLTNQSESSDSGSEEEEEVEVEKEESDDSSTSSDTDDEHQVYEEEGAETFVQQEDNIPEIDKETHRLAVVNMDWTHVKAVDLFVVLSSFLPKGGQIKSVAVYPSEFGLKRMQEEAVHGPIGLFDDDKRKSGDAEDEDEDKDEDEDEVDDEDGDEGEGEGEGEDEDGDDNDDDDDDDDDDEDEDEDEDEDDDDEDEDDDDEIDNEKLRAYELSRLRYYFSVVECDSIATADYLYKCCDGVEFERSSVKLDLRFIPDSMEFNHQPRDVANEAPSDYEGLDFFNRALQHSNINLTWDDDEPHRVRTLKRKFNAGQLAELEFKQFLASDESGSDDTEDDDGMDDRTAKKHKKQKLYRDLVQSGDGSDEEKDDEDKDENQDMEVTFNTGLEDLSKRILERKDAQTESVWEAYLRKKKEKKKARKNRSKSSSEDERSDTDKEVANEPDDFFLEEPSAKGSSQTRGKAAKKDQEMVQNSEASQAELELLVADDKAADPNLKGYNMKRRKKGKEIPDEGKLPTIDYEDPRFSSLFASPHFALDPTDPQFKRSAAYARQLSQKQKKSEKEDVVVKEQSNINGQTAISTKPASDESCDLNAAASKREKLELSSLVRSLKMKAKQMPNQRKVSERDSKLKHNTKISK